MKDTIHNIVSELRKEKGITQEELGKVVGVSRQTIVAIEKGNYMPSLLLGIKIANYFRHHVEDIFTYEK